MCSNFILLLIPAVSRVPNLGGALRVHVLFAKVFLGAFLAEVLLPEKVFVGSHDYVVVAYSHIVYFVV